MTERYMNEIGLNTGLKDRNGIPIHLGDTIHFIGKEWGDKEQEGKTWIIQFSEGELKIYGSLLNITDYCIIKKKWNDSTLGARVKEAYENAVDNNEEVKDWSIYALASDMISFCPDVENDPLDRVVEELQKLLPNARSKDDAHS